MTTTVISSRDRQFLDLVAEVLDRNPAVHLDDIENLMAATKTADPVVAYELMLATENRPAMVRALEAGIRCARRGGAK